MDDALDKLEKLEKTEIKNSEALQKVTGILSIFLMLTLTNRVGRRVRRRRAAEVMLTSLRLFLEVKPCSKPEKKAYPKRQDSSLEE